MATTKKVSKTSKLPKGYPTPEQMFPVALKEYGLTVVNPRLKKADAVIGSAEHTPHPTLHHLYAKPSYAKEDAWNYCQELFQAVKDEIQSKDRNKSCFFLNRGVCGGGSSTFSAGATIDSDLYNAYVYLYITPSYNYCVVKSKNHDRFDFINHIDLTKVKIFED